MLSGISAHAGAILPGFDENTLPATDDGSTGLIPLGFNINFYGNTYSGTYINNNGNITFNGPQSAYTPYPLTSTDNVIIAPFFADVDTRGLASGLVMYSGTMDTLDGHPAFGVDWINVGYYAEATDKLDSFQLILIDRSDTGAGNFDIEFNYDQIQWETGEASGGVDGLGGFSARVGFASGSGESFQLPGSGVNGAFLDSNLVTGLIYNTINGGLPGRYVFNIRNGAVSPLPPIVSTGPEQNAVPGETVTLNASQSSDPQGLPLTFQWVQTGGTPVTLSDSSTSITTFTAPSASGTLGFQVNVSNGQASASGVAEVVISTVATKPATQVTGDAAQLNGSLYAGGIDAQVYFQYGTDTSYGTSTPPQDGGAGTSPVDFSAQITGLSNNTTYHFQAVGVNTSGTFYGIDQVFTPSDVILPIAITNPATGVTTTSGTLNGSVNPQGQDTTVYFQYGTNNFYGQATGSVDIGSGTNPVLVSQLLGALNPGTNYHFRVVAENDSGTTYGGDQSFTTGAPNPPIIGVQEPAGTPLTSNTSVVNYPMAEVGVPQQLKFTVVNSGSGNLTGIAVNVSGGDSADFTANAPVATTLASGSATTFTVAFEPNVSGTFVTTLQVTSNDPVTPSFNIGLSAIALAGGFYPVDISAYANYPIEKAITTVPAPPVGNVTLGGIPFSIPGPRGMLNVWNGAIAESGDNEATVTVPVGLPDVSEVQMLMNTWWGQRGTNAHVDLIFDTGTFTKDLYGDDDIRDYQNFVFTDHINGVTSVQVFTGQSTLDNVPGRMDKMIIPVPAQFQNARLLNVRVIDDGRPFFQRILFMGLTVRVGSGISVEQPADTTLYSNVSSVDFGAQRIGAKVSLEFTVTNNGGTTLGNLKPVITNYDGPEFSASPKSLPGLPPGQSTTFTATYAPTVAGSQSATLHVISSDPATPSFDIALTGTGISPTPQVGAYIGLLNGEPGFVTVDVSANKSLTGTLLLNGKTDKFKGTLNSAGSFTANVGTPPVTVTLQLNVNGDGTLESDYVISGSAGDESVTAYHAAYVKDEVVPEAGTYTMLLQAAGTESSVPQGTGYATLTVSPTGGDVRMTGKLADDTSFTAAGELVSSGLGYNEFLLFDPGIYHGKGLLAGPIAFEALAGSDCNGTLELVKEAQAKGSYYKAGFDTELAADGSLYVKPARGEAALELTSGLFELSGGGLENPIADPVVLHSDNTVTVTDTGDEHLKIAIDPSMGMFTGSFVDPATSKRITFGGLLYQKAPQGGGFFLGPVTDGTGLSGNAVLEP